MQNNSNPLPTKLLSSTEVAGLLRVTQETLAVWRCTKRYELPYVKVGRRVYYKSVDIETFIQSRTQTQI